MAFLHSCGVVQEPRFLNYDSPIYSVIILNPPLYDVQLPTLFFALLRCHL